MPTPRQTDSRTGGTATQDWKQMSSPHGYDQPEFEPALAPRDYKRVRPHGPDDERRRLRDAEAAMERPDPPGTQVEKDEKWDDDDTKEAPVSRLYRD